jgi:Icc-related predicted phosphoesterase
MKILSISDVSLPIIYSPQIRQRFPDVDLVIACGDLPYYYTEYVISALDKPLFYVRGNHDKPLEVSQEGDRGGPAGGTDLHRRLVYHEGVLMAGIEGCLRYRDGPYQYSQTEMWWMVFTLIPGLYWNRLRRGRFLDIFVTHASPHGVHDKPDLPHQGIKAFRWFDCVFRPAIHLHGHIHIYNPETETETLLGETRVINTFGYRETKLDLVEAI